jgi:proline dehydrogenase
MIHIDYILFGTHNVDSCEKIKLLMDKKGYEKNSVIFGQLKGFSDKLTFSLAESNYKVIKYLPYGPTEYLIPYLIRRGNESKEVLREHLFMNDLTKEIRSRFKL